MEAILSSQKFINKNSLYDILKLWIGEGLLISNGRKWFTRRKVITPTFHFKILDEFVEVFDNNSAIMVDRLRKVADGKTVVNIMPYVCLAALDIITGKLIKLILIVFHNESNLTFFTETAMGVKVNAQMEKVNEYAKAVIE